MIVLITVNINVYDNWRTTPCEKNVVLYANNTGVDQPKHARRLISTFVIRALKRKMVFYENNKF